MVIVSMHGIMRVFIYFGFVSEKISGSLQRTCSRIKKKKVEKAFFKGNIK